MITPEELEKIKGIIIDTFTSLNHFYKDPGFYIGFVVGIIGLVVSYASYYQAKKAKEAANSAEVAAKNAAQRVKTQEIIIEILRIINSCSIEIDISYAKASNICNEITSRITHLSGYFTNDPNSVIPDILKNIEADLVNIRSAINNNSPLIQNPLNVPNQIYYSIDPLFTNIFANLGRLQGLLENNSLNN